MHDTLILGGNRLASYKLYKQKHKSSTVYGGKREQIDDSEIDRSEHRNVHHCKDDRTRAVVLGHIVAFAHDLSHTQRTGYGVS